MAQRLSIKRITDALARNRGMVAVAARNLGCSRQNIYDWMERYPELKTVLADEREVMTDVAELSLYKQVQDGQGWAVQFYLKTQGKDRGYVETTNVKHSGDKENPVEMNAHVSDAGLVGEIAALLHTLGTRAADGPDAGGALPLDDQGTPESTPTSG